MRCVYMFVFVWEQTVIPELETAASERTRAFVSWLQESRGFCAAFYVLKYDDSSFFKIFFFVCLFCVTLFLVPVALKCFLNSLSMRLCHCIKQKKKCNRR